MEQYSDKVKKRIDKLTYKVREAERSRQFEDFKDKQGQILSGIIKRVE